MDLRKIQKEHKKWSEYNFGPFNEIDSFFGIIEEVGELSHALLKQKQGIRSNENHEDNIKDAIGDIFIFLMSYATAKGLDMQDIIEDTWNVVKQRDWRKDPANGKKPDKDSSQS